MTDIEEKQLKYLIGLDTQLNLFKVYTNAKLDMLYNLVTKVFIVSGLSLGGVILLLCLK